MLYHNHAHFVTLTYDEENLPKNNSINKEDLQLFFKRLREQIKPIKIKYYAVGEYGEIHGRPHYHIILFGLPEKYFKLREKIYNQKNRKWENCYSLDSWPYGIVHIGNVEPESIKYVTNYIDKVYYGEAFIKKIYGNRQQPFSLMSKGLGARYAKDNEKMIKQHLNITVGGKDVGIPRYYQKKLELDGEAIHRESIAKKGGLSEEDVKLLRWWQKQKWTGSAKFLKQPEELRKIYNQRRTNYEAQQKINKKGTL